MHKLDQQLKDRMESLYGNSHPVLISCNDDCTPVMDHLNKNGIMVDDNLFELQMLVADLTSRQIEDLAAHDAVAKIALDDDASVVL
ncbi:hypothetical protein [Aliiroseovarius sp. 2305UL8-7]|uniref:hypothetical protein n=1 Tax=Aliiroseovarius conchicola TaxID=3121637 RepID=UPI0035274387